MAYATLHDRLRGPIAKTLSEKLSIKNVHALPQIEKVVINVGINKSKMDSKEMQAYIDECLQKIAGQKPVFTKAKQAISNFKIRANMVIGAMVTLRGKQMEEFLDRLISYALPRTRDFRGVTRKFDGHGNYAIGIPDHSIFPEVPPPDAKQIFGLQVQIATTTQSDDEARVLLQEVGIPFRPEPKKEDEGQAEEQAKKKEAEEAAKAEAEPAKEDSSDDGKADDAEKPAEDAAPEADEKEDAPADDAAEDDQSDSDSKS